MKRITYLVLLLAVVSLCSTTASAEKKSSKTKAAPVVTDRDYWAFRAYELAAPVLRLMAEGQLQQKMRTEFSPTFDNRDRRVVYLETFGRLMAGIAPWLSLPEDDTPEGALRGELRRLALAAYKNGADKQSPDYLHFGITGQTLVDAAYVAESFVRAYDALWVPLDHETKQCYIDAFVSLRDIDPPYTNWLLFSSTIESFVAKAVHDDKTLRGKADVYRVNSALRKTDEWYVGDGWYADGQEGFAFDYYSSYVFHAMFIETLQNMIDARRRGGIDYTKWHGRALKRAQKHALILERFISPEGTFPVFGRSIPYRMAAMQPLALMAWYDRLPADISRGQVRAALTKVMHRMYDAPDYKPTRQQPFSPNTQMRDGFLTIGFCGAQPDVADWYTNNGSLYMTSLSLLPLGLPADHPFWTDPSQPWTQVKAWNGQPFPKDHVWKD